MKSIERYHKLRSWVGWLKDIQEEFPGNNVSIGTAIKSFESQLKELEKQ